MDIYTKPQQPKNKWLGEIHRLEKQLYQRQVQHRHQLMEKYRLEGQWHQLARLFEVEHQHLYQLTQDYSLEKQSQLEKLIQRIWHFISQAMLLCQPVSTSLPPFPGFVELPNKHRPPCTTMPWCIWPVLVVLWGVCWMFYWGEELPSSRTPSSTYDYLPPFSKRVGNLFLIIKLTLI